MADIGPDYREQLRDYKTIRQASVIVHEWPDEPTIHVAELTWQELQDLAKETRRRAKRDKSRIRHIERMVIACARLKDGSPMFKPEDEDWITKLGAAGLINRERSGPFTRVRLDLMAWMVARNVGEMFGGRLRSPARAVWGHNKRRMRRRKDVKPQTDAKTVDQFAQALGIPQTKAEG